MKRISGVFGRNFWVLLAMTTGTGILRSQGGGGIPQVDTRHLPQAGMFHYYRLVANPPSAGYVTPSGPDQFWDFSHLVAWNHDTVMFLEPFRTPFFASFPLSDYAILITFSEGEVDTLILYLKRDSSGAVVYDWIEGVGGIFTTQAIVDAIGSSSIVSEAIQKDYFIRVPFSYGETYSGSGEYRPQNDPTRRILLSHTDVADAWGKIVIPGGDTFEVLRIHRVMTFTLEVKVLGSWVPVNSLVIEEYFFYDTLHPVPVVRIHVNPDNPDTLHSIRYLVLSAPYDSSLLISSGKVFYWQIYRDRNTLYIINATDPSLVPDEVQVFSLTGRTIARRYVPGQIPVRIPLGTLAPVVVFIRKEEGFASYLVPPSFY